MADGYAEAVGQQYFHKSTDLGVIGDQQCQWTVGATKDNLSVQGFRLAKASPFAEKRSGLAHPVGEVVCLDGGTMVRS